MHKRLRGSSAAELGPGERARLAFLGAAGEVTGSSFLLRTPRSRVLVECGLFQGGREARAKNRAPFRFDPRGLDAVILTHAHVDHSGLLPRLVAEGYGGRIEASSGTAELCAILLRDAAYLQELDAGRHSKKRERKGLARVAPLYTLEDAERAILRLRERRVGERFRLTQDLSARLCYAGHILGATSVELFLEGREEEVLVLSGDVGPWDAPLIRDPDPPQRAHLVVMESTYGGRDHRPLAETLDELAGILREAAEKRAKVIVPAFAVGRSQEILFHIGELERAGRIPTRRVFVDSPMAIGVTELYRRFREDFHPAVRERHAGSNGELEPAQLVLSRTQQESMALNDVQDAIVISASGMCEGGRILHHLKHNLWRAGTHLLVIGFQAEGTLGRAIVDGAKKVRVMGEEILVRAKVHTLGGFSAHAGQRELLRWLESVQGAPQVALVHGEEQSRTALADCIRERSGRAALLPAQGEELVLGDAGAWRLERGPAQGAEV